MSSTSGGPVWCRSKEVAFVDDGERVVLLALRRNVITNPQVLNGPAGSIWRALDGKRTTLDIAKAITALGDVSLEPAMTQTEEFLQRLQGLGLVHLRTDPPVTYPQREG